jgi:hypothetical protein
MKTNPLFYYFFVMLNFLIVGIGAGMGIYKSINKLFDYWLSIKVNTDQIPSLIEINKSQNEEITEIKKCIEEHDLEIKNNLKEKS